MKVVSRENIDGKKVLLRLDLDVPIRDGRVVDDTRLLGACGTVEILKSASSLVVCGSLGRPDGRQESLSTKNLTSDLNRIFGVSFKYVNDFYIKNFDNKYQLLENLRFWEGEEANDGEFAGKLADGFDCFVNESFAMSHRVAASTVGVAGILESYAGLRLADEVSHLSGLTENPARPLVAIIGGAKIETKLPVITALSRLADKVLVGGLLPKEISQRGISFSQNVFVAKLTESGMDVSEESLKLFEQEISKAKEIVWNGPVGNFEDKLYSSGTERVVKILMDSKARITVGGGDTISALNQFGDSKKVNWISLGGGAMLSFIAGEKLPGIEALN